MQSSIVLHSMLCSTLMEYLSITDSEKMFRLQKQLNSIFSHRFSLIREKRARDYFRDVFLDSVERLKVP